MSDTLSINDRWKAANVTSVAVENGWLETLQNAELSIFIDEVLVANPNYNEVALRMQAAGFTADASAGRLLPRIGASANASRTGVDKPISNTSSSYSIGLDASWEVDVWGKLSANVAAARSNYEVAEYDFYGARLSLAAQVAQGWFNVIEAKQQWDLSVGTVENYDQATRIVRNRFARGLSSGLDLRLSITNLEAARATEKQRESSYYQALRTLELFAGQYPAAEMVVSGNIPDELADIPVGVPL
ncbi:MAG: TolC family protein, partial [Emcibacteraceae bacterium]|nr:TolC family protein [Emcibacteraceae bacterium]